MDAVAIETRDGAVVYFCGTGTYCLRAMGIEPWGELVPVEVDPSDSCAYCAGCGRRIDLLNPCQVHDWCARMDRLFEMTQAARQFCVLWLLKFGAPIRIGDDDAWDDAMELWYDDPSLDGADLFCLVAPLFS